MRGLSGGVNDKSDVLAVSGEGFKHALLIPDVDVQVPVALDFALEHLTHPGSGSIGSEKSCAHVIAQPDHIHTFVRENPHRFRTN